MINYHFPHIFLLEGSIEVPTVFILHFKPKQACHRISMTQSDAYTTYPRVDIKLINYF